MDVIYMSDGEQTAIMSLDTLIGNFNANDGWRDHATEPDLRYELGSRGWFEGCHDFGRYLVVSLDKCDAVQPRAYWR
jgi:hypothetical protein